MIRRSRNIRYTATSASGGGDTDTLQTDVMRFMSILGLCLMAVFALVQSIPLQEKDTGRPAPAQRELYQAISIQQERVNGLEADVERLMAQAHSAEERQRVAQRALLSARQQLTQIAEQTAQVRSDRERLKAELNELRSELANGRDELAGIKQAVESKTVSLGALQRQLNVEKKKLDDISRRTLALRSKRAQTQRAQTPDSPAPKKRPSPVSGSQKQGFTLRFASAQALEHLVAAGTVSLYAMAGKQAWRLSLSDGGPFLTPDAFPGWFHEMSPSTVPATYLRSMRSEVGSPVSSSVVWGVQLPEATKQGISALTRGLRGGNLVIAADGRVSLEPE